MKDWEEQLEALEARMTEWNASYDKEFKRLSKERGLNSWFKRPAKADLEAAAHDARQAAGGEVLLDAFRFLDEVGEHFMNSLPQPRGLIRARVGAADNLFEFLWSYIVQTPELIQGSSDGPRVRAGLAGVCIDDGRSDFDELHEALGAIWIATSRAGLDPREYFADAAEVANKGAGGGGTFLRSILEDFESSVWFREKAKAEPGADWARRSKAS